MQHDDPEVLEALIKANEHLLSFEKDPEQIKKLQEEINWDKRSLPWAKERAIKRKELKVKQMARVGKVTPLGSFESLSNKLRITDPCYDKDTWCAGVLENTLPGKWFAYIQYRNEGDWGIRNSTLFAVHESCLKKQRLEHGYLYHNHLENLSEIHVGVDSGQAGIFDESKYPDEPRDDDDNDEENKGFYNRCGIQSIGDGKNRRWNEGEGRVDALSAGVVDEGCVSLSGDGDGGYRCFFNKNANGKIDAVEISFYYHDNEPDEETEDENTESESI